MDKIKEINIKEIPPGLTYTGFVVAAQKQTGITYVGDEGKRITRDAYGRYKDRKISV